MFPGKATDQLLDIRKHNLLLTVIESLHQHGSWTGKTHVQKAMFLLHAAKSMKVPFGFVLYKHGPYSFDIENELAVMKTYAAITSEPALEGYGVIICPGENASWPKERAPLAPEEESAVERVCAFVRQKNVLQLEKIATAAWIRTQEGIQDSQRVAARLHELKPHVSLDDALQADSELITISERRATL